MSKFYGQVFGSAKTVATKRGTNDIAVSAQSWNGSLITRLYYKDDELMVELSHSDDSSSRGYTVFNGPMTQFLETMILGKKAFAEMFSNKEVA